jgi:hypothetical protein
MIQSRPSAERPLPRASRPFAGQARSGSILPVRQAVRQWPVFAHCGRVPRRLRTAVTPSAQARDWTLTLICNVDHHASQGARGYLAARSLCVPKDARFRYSTGMPAASAASIPRLIPGVIPRSCRRPMPRRPQLHGPDGAQGQVAPPTWTLVDTSDAVGTSSGPRRVGSWTFAWDLSG